MNRRGSFLVLASVLALAVAGCNSEIGSEPGGGPEGGDLTGSAEGTGGGEASGAPQFPGAGDGAGGLAGGSMVCFYPADGSSDFPAATMEWALETTDTGGLVHARLTMSPYFVDNSYGVNAIGWGHRGHTFADLYRSDHAELVFRDGADAVVLDFLVDYITQDPSTPSGWASLGVGGGDGKMVTGDAALVVDTQTSLDRNFNERGYSSYTVDSPATDESYTPNPAAPGWDYRVVYEAWVAQAAFGGAGFGSVLIDHIHASPSKVGEDTVYVVAGDCPDSWTCYGDACGDLSGGGGDTPPEGDCPDGNCELCVQNSDCAPGKECINGVCLPEIY